MASLGSVSASIAKHLHQWGMTLGFARKCAILFVSLALLLTFFSLTNTVQAKRDTMGWLIFWLFAPPVWFLVEYQIWKAEQERLSSEVDGSSQLVHPSRHVTMEDLKYGQELASKLWAAVVALLVLVITES